MFMYCTYIHLYIRVHIYIQCQCLYSIAFYFHLLSFVCLIRVPGIGLGWRKEDSQIDQPQIPFSLTISTDVGFQTGW